MHPPTDTLSDDQWNTKAHREKMIELFFEKYNVPAFYLAKAPMLSRCERIAEWAPGRAPIAARGKLRSSHLTLLLLLPRAASPTAGVLPSWSMLAPSIRR
jgi:hypothetical protein